MIKDIIFSVMNFLFMGISSFTGDIGVTIVLFTLVVRLMLMPFSLSQRRSVEKQQKVSIKIEELKEKYKNNKEKLDMETQKYYMESMKGMTGCLVSLFQVPVLFMLYSFIINMPIAAGTVLLPWISSLKVYDRFFIIPVLYALIQMSPGLISSIINAKSAPQVSSKGSLIFTSLMSLIITVKAPAAVGLYFISSALFTLIEEIGWAVYAKKRKSSFT